MGAVELEAVGLETMGLGALGLETVGLETLGLEKVRRSFPFKEAEEHKKLGIFGEVLVGRELKRNSQWRTITSDFSHGPHYSTLKTHHRMQV